VIFCELLLKEDYRPDEIHVTQNTTNSSKTLKQSTALKWSYNKNLASISCIIKSACSMSFKVKKVIQGHVENNKL